MDTERFDDFSQEAPERQGEPDAIFRDSVASFGEFKDIFNSSNDSAASTVAAQFGGIELIDDDGGTVDPDGSAGDAPKFAPGVIDDAPSFVPGVIDEVPSFDPSVVESLDIPSMPTSLDDLTGDLLSKIPKFKDKAHKPAPEKEKEHIPPREAERELPNRPAEREPREILQDRNPATEKFVKRDPSGRVTEVNNERGKTEIFRDENGDVTGLNLPDGSKLVKVGDRWFDLQSDPKMEGSGKQMDVLVSKDGTVTERGRVGDLGFINTHRPDGTSSQETRTKDGTLTVFEFDKTGKAQRIVQVSPDGRKAQEIKFD